MSTATIVIEGDSPRILHPLTGDDSASKRLKECARVLREHVKRLRPQPATPAATWLLENHSFLQFQIRETRASLPASYLRVLPKTGEGAAAEPRVYRLAADFLERHPEFSWQKPLLRDMKAGPWTTFKSGQTK